MLHMVSRKRRDAFYFILGFLIAYAFGYYIRFTMNQRNGKCELGLKPVPTAILPKEPSNFLLVAVITTRTFLKTRAKAIFETWGSRVPGNIKFFVGGSQPYNGNLPVVLLNGISDNAYPPQLKSFAMIEYISNHFINDYEWFMRGDDDIFVKINRLEKFLRTINSSKTLFIGQPGFGKPEEIGKLGLENSPYCMGGPGVILTKSTIQKIKFHLQECLQNTASYHEDTELGRCILTHAGIPCTISEEFDHMFVHRLGSNFNQNIGLIDERAITLHPVKQHLHMYRWDIYFSSKSLNHLRSQSIDLSDADILFKNMIQHNNKTTSQIFENEEPLQETITRENHKFTTSKYEKIVNDEYWELLNYTDILKAVSSATAWKTIWYKTDMRGWRFLPETYQRISHGTHMENIITKNYFDNITSISIRTIHRVTTHEFSESRASITSTIWIILPLYKRFHTYVSFITMLSETVQTFKGTLNLRVVLYVDDDGEFIKTKRYSMTVTRKLNISLILLHGNFSRGKAMTSGIKGLPHFALLLFIDVDMVFDDFFLNRVILNTEYKKQVYFPICFSQFDPAVICFNEKTCNLTAKHVSNQFGIWREFGYGIVSIFKADLLRLGGYNLDIKGWGYEDLDLYDKCIKLKLTIFRAVDPTLVHIYHDKICDPSLPDLQYYMCIGSRNSHFGSQESLLYMIDKLQIEM